MFKHLSECELFKDCRCLYSLSSLFNVDEHDDISLTSHIFNAVLQNFEILGSNRNWSHLAFLEAIIIQIMILLLTIVSKPQKNFYYLIKF